MAISYSEFDTTQANLIADLKTKILLNVTDYTNPTGNVVQATTTRGATIAVDLSGYQISTMSLSPKAWRLFSGGVGTDAAPQKWMWWNISNAGATTEPLHVRVAASKEFLYFDIEGPRAGEANADSASNGSARNYFYLGDVVPYLAGDTVPVVCMAMGGQTSNTTTATDPSKGTHIAYVSRNYDNTSPWRAARLFVPRSAASFRTGGGQANTVLAYQPYSKDGNYQMFPFIVMEDQDGLRGRLAGIYSAGYTYTDFSDVVLPGQPGERITYNSQTYKLIAVNKGSTLNFSAPIWGPLGSVDNDNNTATNSPLVALQIA